MESRENLRHRAAPFLLSGVLFVCTAAQAQVVITEIAYNPAAGGNLEYVEVHNTGATVVDISGWAFTDGIELHIPDGTALAPGAYGVVAKSKAALLAAHPALGEGAILGEFEGSLANEGEAIRLAAAGGATVDEVEYDDDPPWDFLADGFGASLERLCFTTDGRVAENWRASATPPSPDTAGGSPGEPNAASLCPPITPARPRVLISEVLYHPVLEQALEDFHEFVEIHNADDHSIALAGWRLAGGIDYTFPDGASIAPGQYLVVAKDREQLAAVEGYGLAGADILGNYGRNLDNGGDKVALIGPEGQGVDSMSYDDDAPWPAGADALGADEDWLPPELLPLESHRHRGHSLERVSFTVPSGELANWAPSPLDGATPGRPNASARSAPLPVVAEHLVAPLAGPGPLIRADEAVRIQVRFTPQGPSGPVQLEYFLDAIMGGADGPVTAVPMYDDALGGGDLLPGDGIFTATLPGLADNSLVRFRFLADRGAGMERVSPRPSDPNPWHAYFVSPLINTQTRVYQVLIAPVEWGKMWTGIQAGRVAGCAPSPTWDVQVPAVFVHEGRVIDVRVRYQGSRWNRTNGPNIANWPHPRPTSGPTPLRALSWRIEFPRYDQLGGLGVVILNKLTQGCPGYNAGVGYRLFAMTGMPASQTRFIRFHVNGGYYHYMMELERGGEEMIRRYLRERREAEPGLPREGVGDLFKSAGCNCDEGPYGWGDERALAPSCGHTKETRYRYTYDRKTNGWASYDELIRLLEDLAAAKRAGTEALRDYFAERFDLEQLFNYIAIMNYSVPFDDMFQNHFLYQRLGDGKWIIFPWDLDQNFGEWKGATASIYMGESGDVDNRSGWWNVLKDAFLKSYREEFNERLLLLNNTILHPDVIARLVDEVTAVANPAEAAQAPAGVQCSFPGRASSFKAFAVQRYAVVNTKVAGVSLNAGVDQTVYAGAVVQFDASKSTPDPSVDVPYRWDNGMEGENPTASFQEPGPHVVTLTVSVKGVEFKDSVTINVLPLPVRAFHEVGGQVVLEAESFTDNDSHGSANTFWEPAAAAPGYSGAGYMLAREIRRTSFLQRYASTAPELRFAVLFETPGEYRVWLRASCAEAAADSCYVGLDGVERESKYSHQFTVDPTGAFLWAGDTRTAGPQVLTVARPGLHAFSIWIRESRQTVDKVILTRDAGLVPAAAGPAESELVRIVPPTPFIRSDTDGDGIASVGDAIAILRHLFAGVPLACEDPGDVDDSGVVQVTDAVVLVRFLFLSGAPPTSPFPEVGLDPTPDRYECGGP